MRTLARILIAATAVVVAGCSGSQEAAVPVTVTVTATPASPPGLRAAVYAYSHAYLSGDRAAYPMLSKRCQARIAPGDFTMTLNLAATSIGPQSITSYRERVSGGFARVSYTFARADLDQLDEPWVFEAGRWREDDC